MDALNYNEQKVQKGKAECIAAGNYLNEPQTMNFYQKLAGFENLNVLNDRATTKTLHVSLNFDPSEKLSTGKLTEIASSYMEKIGFGNQPYLVYKHFDAGHPHVHIVSTTIQEDGSRINTHNIGRNQSEKARKEIEQNFNLIRAENQKKTLKQAISPVDVSKVIYGKSETKSSITNVINAVINSYKFTSIPEFNAVLKQFNVMADRGNEEGRIYKHRGLVYRILNANGNKIGVPIKASSINSKPTLNILEKKFVANEAAREPYKQKVKNIIDEILSTVPNDMKQLIAALEKKQIYTMLRQNQEGRLYGITFVDNQNKCVFNGSDLGKGYSASALQTRMSASESPVTKNALSQEMKISEKSTPYLQKNLNIQEQKEQSTDKSLKIDKMFEHLLLPKHQSENVPFQLLKKKRKREKRNLGL